MVTRAKATKQAAFCISADISAAHRCVKIKKSDWGRLGCKTCSSSQTLWINTVGTFGVSSASYHWSRLFGAIGRWALRIMAQRWTLQIIYVDDLHAAYGWRAHRSTTRSSKVGTRLNSWGISSLIPIIVREFLKGGVDGF